ncbi:CRISPR-associated endonuclease Cas2 [Methylobacter psychrophilus]|uniref:CRISPR-associated endonuclease Cas2 n=1 Tax=Methylobacter psychrophilus TaxID=96941 RepID=UPI0021D4A1E0|nr:CRISPR-associated endonuclease Cas2 [Methylobacter psychrophilus]
MSSRLWVIAFDVSSQRRRYRVVKRLRQDAVPVARSVFEGILTPGRLVNLKADLAQHIDPLTDSIRFYPACAWCEENILRIGVGVDRAQAADYYLF